MIKVPISKEQHPQQLCFKTGAIIGDQLKQVSQRLLLTSLSLKGYEIL